jgi:N-acetylglucosamine-6-phosphate deacetylase
MITATPARIAGLASQKGALLKGMDADIVVFDDAINIHTTIVGGNIIFVNESNMVTKNNLK